MAAEHETINRFSKAMVKVRYAFLREDGEIVGCDKFELQDFGWTVPVKGDKVMKLHDPPDFETAVVADRIFVNEGFGEFYWLIILTDVLKEDKYLEDIANHMWLVTDLERHSADASVPMEEIAVRMKQLMGLPSGFVRRVPMSRDPEPDRDDEDDNHTP